MLRKLLFISCLSCIPCGIALAQVTNTGQVISISANGLLFIDNSYTHQDSYILNNGELNIIGNWLNNSTSLVFDNQSAGTVNFAGGQQKIGGSFRTGFPNLSLSGSGYKSLEIDADVNKVLALNNIELKANQFSLNILNPAVGSITRTSGFISTDKKGRIFRSTFAMGSYLFPFGSSVSGSVVYRPVSIEPQSSGTGSYHGTFHPQDPTLSGYDKNIKRKDIGNVFDRYFYVLSSTSGTGLANVNFHQNTADGDYKQLVKWASTNIWEKAAPSTATTGSFADGLNRSLLFTSTEHFTDQAFSFATAESTEDPLTLFNAFSPDGDGKNDSWLVKNIELYPNNELLIFNRWGDEVFKMKNYSSANAWDGGNLQSGTYFYVLTVEINGQKKAYKGFISMAKK